MAPLTNSRIKRALPFLLRVAPLLPVAGLAIAVSAQTGCSSDSATTTTPATTADAGSGVCRGGETLRQIGTRSLCCTSTTTTEASCSEAAAPRAKDPCAKDGETTRAADQVNVTFDVCVKEECDGNRNALEYAAVSSLTTGSLACATTASGALVWQNTGATDSQKVTRTCSETSRTSCGGGYGYGYGYGATTVPVRNVTLVSSVCTKSGGAGSPCDVGAL
jgi:hypothetical protein